MPSRGLTARLFPVSGFWAPWLTRFSISPLRRGRTPQGSASQAPVSPHSVVKEFGIGEVSSFVQEEVEAPAFDLQGQHGWDLPAVRHAGHLAEGDREMRPESKGGVRGERHLLPAGQQPHGAHRAQGEEEPRAHHQGTCGTKGL